MKRIVYAVTHAQKTEGANPRLTEQGEDTITNLVSRIPSERICGVIIGTGSRFQHTYDAIKKTGALDEIQPKYSPLLGSPDSGVRSESGWDVILADGTLVKAGFYLGLIDANVDMIDFLDRNTKHMDLLVTGREFIGTLIEGGADKAKSAAVYEITIDDGPEIGSKIQITEIQ